MFDDKTSRQDKIKNIEFPSIEDVSIDSIDQERSLDRQSYTQPSLIEGSNKAIIFKDDSGITRMIIGNLDQKL